MFQQITTSNQQKNLFSQGSNILLAVSGGIDSMFLLHYFNWLKDKMSLQLSCVHVNHQQRTKAEFEVDITLIKQICCEKSIPFCLETISLGKSDEASLRDKRYAMLEKVRINCGAQYIATAHTQDDQVETFFLRLFRGSGLHGLRGIPQKNNRIIRPLLEVKKKDIQLWMEENGCYWVEDSTNQSQRFDRNRLRLTVLPQILAAFPKYDKQVIELMNKITVDDAYLEKQMENWCFSYRRVTHGGYYFKVKELNELDESLRNRLFRKSWQELSGQIQGFEKRHVKLLEQGLFAGAGPGENLPEKICYSSTSEHFHLYNESQISSCFQVLLMDDSVVELSAKIAVQRKLPYDLTVRSRKPGDRITLHKRGTVKVKKLLSESQIPVHLRHLVPVVESSSGKILQVGNWVDKEFVEGNSPIVFCSWGELELLVTVETKEHKSPN